MTVKADPSPPSRAGKGSGGFLSDLLVLAKVRITVMVMVSTAVGYVLAAGPLLDGWLLAGLLAATFLLGAGVNALNQYMERKLDGLMARTRNRPLPAGRMRPGTALLLGGLACAGGLVWLTVGVNLMAGGIGLVVLFTYLLCYTPLKRLSGLNTLVGAIPGALPPVLGWAAGAEELGREALALFLILFVWQLPHFLSIAHLYRDDYASAGMPMLTVVDPSGGLARRQLIVYTATMIPVSMYPSLIGLTAEIYFFGALAMSLVYFAAALRMALRTSQNSARALLRVSVIYLPALYALMIFDARVF